MSFIKTELYNKRGKYTHTHTFFSNCANMQNRNANKERKSKLLIKNPTIKSNRISAHTKAFCDNAFNTEMRAARHKCESQPFHKCSCLFTREPYIYAVTNPRAYQGSYQSELGLSSRMAAPISAVCQRRKEADGKL